MTTLGTGDIVPCVITISNLVEAGERRLLVVIGPPREQATRVSSSQSVRHAFRRKIRDVRRKRKRDSFTVELKGEQTVIERREQEEISTDRRAAHMTEILEHGGASGTVEAGPVYTRNGGHEEAVLSRLRNTKGTVHVLGCFEADHAMQIQKYTTRLAQGKKAKPITQFLTQAGDPPSRPLDELFPASSLITRASMIACGESSIAVVGMYRTLLLARSYCFNSPVLL